MLDSQTQIFYFYCFKNVSYFRENSMKLYVSTVYEKLVE